MQLTEDQVMQIIGVQHCEIVALRMSLTQAQSRIKELEPSKQPANVVPITEATDGAS